MWLYLCENLQVCPWWKIFKDPGTVFSHLDWVSYYVSINKTASEKIGALICSKKFLSFEVAFYKSTIRPSMEYCCHVWGVTWICWRIYRNGYIGLICLIFFFVLLCSCLEWIPFKFWNRPLVAHFVFETVTWNMKYGFVAWNFAEIELLCIYFSGIFDWIYLFHHH